MGLSRGERKVRGFMASRLEAIRSFCAKRNHRTEKKNWEITRHVKGKQEAAPQAPQSPKNPRWGTFVPIRGEGAPFRKKGARNPMDIWMLVKAEWFPEWMRRRSCSDIRKKDYQRQFPGWEKSGKDASLREITGGNC